MQAAKKVTIPQLVLIAPSKITTTSKPVGPTATPASPGKALASPARKAAIPNQSVPHTRDEDSPLDDTGSIPAAQPTPAAAKPPLKRAAAAAAGNSPTGPSARSRAPQLDPSAQFKG